MSREFSFGNMESPGPNQYMMAKSYMMSNSVSGNYAQKGIYEGKKAEPIINPKSLIKQALDPLYNTAQMYIKK